MKLKESNIFNLISKAFPAGSPKKEDSLRFTAFLNVVSQDLLRLKWRSLPILPSVPDVNPVKWLANSGIS